MEYNYWLSRSVHAFGMARSATSATARLIHLQLAGAYSVKAAECEECPADWNAIGRTTPQAPTVGALAAAPPPHSLRSAPHAA